MFTAVLVLLAITVPVTAPPPPPANDGFVLLADDWARPRTGASVVALPALRAAVDAWRRDERAVIQIVHPGGERGSLWGREVRDWLVALGIPPAHLAILPGGPRDDAVLLRVATSP